MARERITNYDAAVRRAKEVAQEEELDPERALGYTTPCVATVRGRVPGGPYWSIYSPNEGRRLFVHSTGEVFWRDPDGGLVKPL